MGATREESAIQYRNRLARVGGRITWFEQALLNQVNLSMDKRLSVLAQLMRDMIVANISMPVGRNEAGTIVQRSVAGEFPRAETARLMRDIFWDRKAPLVRIVGTSLDYGLWLELALDRSFLRRTLEERRSQVVRIMTQPIN